MRRNVTDICKYSYSRITFTEHILAGLLGIMRHGNGMNLHTGNHKWLFKRDFAHVQTSFKPLEVECACGHVQR